MWEAASCNMCVWEPAGCGSQRGEVSPDHKIVSNQPLFSADGSALRPPVRRPQARRIHAHDVLYHRTRQRLRGDTDS